MYVNYYSDDCICIKIIILTSFWSPVSAEAWCLKKTFFSQSKRLFVVKICFGQKTVFQEFFQWLLIKYEQNNFMRKIPENPRTFRLRVGRGEWRIIYVPNFRHYLKNMNYCFGTLHHVFCFFQKSLNFQHSGKASRATRATLRTSKRNTDLLVSFATTRRSCACTAQLTSGSRWVSAHRN